MPIAIAAGLIGSAVASVASAKIQSNAAKTAAQQQQTATNQGLAVQKQAQQPYMDMGQQALGNLTARPFQPFNQSFTGAGGSQGIQPQQPPPMQQPQGAGAFNPMGGIAPQQPTLGGIGGQSQGPSQGGMVTVQDDTGATRQVPQAQAQLYAQRGFKVLGAGGAPSGPAPVRMTS